jgi:hypothetical protein
LHQCGSLQQERPRECLDRADFLIPLVSRLDQTPIFEQIVRPKYRCRTYAPGPARCANRRDASSGRQVAALDEFAELVSQSLVTFQACLPTAAAATASVVNAIDGVPCQRWASAIHELIRLFICNLILLRPRMHWQSAAHRVSLSSDVSPRACCPIEGDIKAESLTTNQWHLNPRYRLLNVTSLSCCVGPGNA